METIGVIIGTILAVIVIFFAVGAVFFNVFNRFDDERPEDGKTEDEI